jgi:hypothetical protein
MQDLILIISRCVSKRKSIKAKKLYYKFHFKGFYMGEKIKIIHLFPTDENKGNEQLSKGVDYLLWVKRREISHEILEVDLIKYKKII